MNLTRNSGAFLFTDCLQFCRQRPKLLVRILQLYFRFLLFCYIEQHALQKQSVAVLVFYEKRLVLNPDFFIAFIHQTIFRMKAFTLKRAASFHFHPGGVRRVDPVIPEFGLIDPVAPFVAERGFDLRTDV